MGLGDALAGLLNPLQALGRGGGRYTSPLCDDMTESCLLTSTILSPLSICIASVISHSRPSSFFSS